MIRDQTLLRDEHSFMLLFVRARVVMHVCSRRLVAYFVLSVVCEVDKGVAGRGGNSWTDHESKVWAGRRIGAG